MRSLATARCCPLASAACPTLGPESVDRSELVGSRVETTSGFSWNRITWEVVGLATSPIPANHSRSIFNRVFLTFRYNVSYYEWEKDRIIKRRIPMFTSSISRSISTFRLGTSKGWACDSAHFLGIILSNRELKYSCTFSISPVSPYPAESNTSLSNAYWKSNKL